MKNTFPKPASLHLPDGVHHADSEWDHSVFSWQDSDWCGIAKHQLVIYELHVGTFTPEGTFDALANQIDYLLELGITAIELLPLAECPGRWNWGYDGVGLYACLLYTSPSPRDS